MCPINQDYYLLLFIYFILERREGREKERERKTDWLPLVRALTGD